MSWTRWLLLPALLAVMGVPRVASAIDPPSDQWGKDYRALNFDANAAAVLMQRLLEAESQRRFHDIVSDFRKNPDKYKALLANKNPQTLKASDLDPAFQQLLKRSAGAGKLDVDDLKAMQELLKKQLDAGQHANPLNGKGSGGKFNSVGPTQLAPPPPYNSNKPDLFKNLFKDVEHGKFGKLGDKVMDTDSFKEAKDLFNKQPAGIGIEGGGSKSGTSDAVLKAFANMDWKEGGTKLSLPGTGVLKWFKAGDSSAGPSDTGQPTSLGRFVGPPSFGLPSAASASDGLWLVQVLLILAALAGILVLVWRLLARVAARDVHAALRTTVWPVKPGEVSTRQQLILAFEHLALVILGPEARTTNHRAIASGLGATPDRRGAADELALLYERARYDPVEGELPAADLAAARRDLCLLAGMTAS